MNIKSRHNFPKEERLSQEYIESVRNDPSSDMGYILKKYHDALNEAENQIKDLQKEKEQLERHLDDLNNALSSVERA